MAEHLKKFSYLTFILIRIFFVRNSYCQNQQFYSYDENNSYCIEKIANLLNNKKLEKAIKESSQCSANDTEAILIVLPEDLKNFEDMKIIRDYLFMDHSAADTTIIQMIRKINCNQNSTLQQLEFSFLNSNFKTVYPNRIDLTLWPGHLIVVYLKEKKVNNVYDTKVINYYPEVNYYNLKRKSTSLLGLRLSALSSIGSFAWYSIRRFYIDENNYKHYLNAPTLYDANRLKQKCKDGRKITNYAGAIAIASGLLFGYFFTKDIFWPWVSGKEQLLALNMPNKNRLSHAQILPQLGCQTATINISYRF